MLAVTAGPESFSGTTTLQTSNNGVSSGNRVTRTSSLNQQTKAAICAVPDSGSGDLLRRFCSNDSFDAVMDLNGKWQQDDFGDPEQFMKAVGIGFIKRKVV